MSEMIRANDDNVLKQEPSLTDWVADLVEPMMRKTNHDVSVGSQKLLLTDHKSEQCRPLNGDANSGEAKPSLPDRESGLAGLGDGQRQASKVEYAYNEGKQIAIRTTVRAGGELIVRTEFAFDGKNYVDRSGFVANRGLYEIRNHTEHKVEPDSQEYKKAQTFMNSLQFEDKKR